MYIEHGRTLVECGSVLIEYGIVMVEGMVEYGEVRCCRAMVEYDCLIDLGVIPNHSFPSSSSHCRLLLFPPFPSLSLSLSTLFSPQLRVESPPEMASSLAEQRGQQRRFLEQLLDTSKLENYTVPIPIKADLRKYQQVRYQGG